MEGYYVKGQTADFSKQTLLLQDIIGDAKYWPQNVMKLFWTKNMKHFDRVILSAFVFVNGLNPDVFMDWLDVIEVSNAIKNHFSYLLQKFEADPNCYKLYAWNISMQRYEWLNGQI